MTPLDRGFSLLETLIATTIVAVALAALGQVALASARANRTARATTIAVNAAREKMEALRALAYAFAPDGSLVADGLLTPSPPGALEQNVSGYAEELDAAGRVLAAGTAARPAYIRRWSIRPLSDSAAGTLLMQVRVVTADHESAEVRLAALKPRRVRR